MSYIIEQKIKGHTYLYEVESYWDPDKKQSRQRRKYLGKKDPESGQAITPRKMPVVKSASDYGHVYLVDQLAEHIGLKKTLEQTLGADTTQSVLSLAYFQVIEGKPWYLYPTWNQDTSPHLKKQSSQDISRLLAECGQDSGGPQGFFRAWAQHQKPLNGVWLDITSLSSYAQNNSWCEWGYNRDHEALPQVNLGVLMGGASHLPFFYQLYPGSIADVSTLNNISLRAKDLGFAIDTWVMDRGFFSADNLQKLADGGHHFMTAMPLSLKAANTLLTQSYSHLRSPMTSFCLGKEVLFFHDTTCTVGKLELRACVYQNEKRRVKEVEAFMLRLESVEQAAEGKAFNDMECARTWLNQQWKGCTNLFTIKLGEKGELSLARKRNALSWRMNRMGKMIMVTNAWNLTPKEMLEQYRRKDCVEKVYDTLKNGLNEDRLRVHSTETMHGKMFVTFVALILHTELTHRLYSSVVAKKYTVPEVIMELRKLRLFFRTENQPPFLSEISKRQRDIFTALNIPAPENPRY